MTENINVEIDYDKEGDILEIFIGVPSSSYFNEIYDDLFEGRDKKTGVLKGYKILNLTKRGRDLDK
ncbi:MAG: hypothetical protein AABW75_03940 [Nanoarchaeota archaeon]